MSRSYQHLTLNHAAETVTVTLSREKLHNAFNAELIAELTAVFLQLDQDDSIRVVILTGAGSSFSAGADLNWMRAMATASEAENREDSLRLAAMFRAINKTSKPVVARVNGHAFGGGVGLIACADIVVSIDSATYGLTEVRLGLIPATIAPFVQAKIGAGYMRRYAISGDRFGALQAQHMGLVHDVVGNSQLDQQVQQHVKTLLQAGPKASAECKRLIARISQLQNTAASDVDVETAAWIARLRGSSEGQQGLQAFLDKHTPAWVKDSD